MSCLKRYTSTISTICVVGALCCGVPALADGDPGEAVAQEIDVKTSVSMDAGNGVPSGEQVALTEEDGVAGNVKEKTSDIVPALIAEKTDVPVSAENELRPDEQEALSEEAVATVTADGDFLLPTYLLPGETANVERTTTIEKIYEKPSLQPKTIQNQIVVQDQIIEQERNVEAKQDVTGRQTARTTVVDRQEQRARQDELDTLLRQAEEEGYRRGIREGTKKVEVPKKLLIPLAPLPSVEKAEPALPPHQRAVIHGEYADQMVGSLKSGDPLAFKMPHELKIIFYPKASAFSGQTLKWIKGFALAAVDDPRLIVEVRASCAEADLQATRLKLVKDALKGAGLSTHQIVINYTNRPVDTMLLRAVPRIEAEELVLTKKDQKLPKSMSQVRKW